MTGEPPSSPGVTALPLARAVLHVLDDLGLTAVVGADSAELGARYTTAGFTVRSTGGTHYTLTRTPNPAHSIAADR